MRIIKIWCDTGYVGSEREEIIKVPDDATEKEIEKEVLDVLLDVMVNYGYEEVKDYEI